jgi:protein TonB
VAPQPQEEPKFVAPIETPAEIQPEEGISLGVEGGVPGGVEGGVPGGVVGGIVGGLPQEAPPPVTRAVRVGGNLKAPQILKKVDPVYPELAKTAHVGGLVILEATVGTDGRVKEVTILRGQPLFNDAALAAVRQWVYRPLLLNGVPTEFILTVTLSFSFKTTAPGIGGP